MIIAMGVTQDIALVYDDGVAAPGDGPELAAAGISYGATLSAVGTLVLEVSGTETPVSEDAADDYVKFTAYSTTLPNVPVVPGTLTLTLPGDVRVQDSNGRMMCGGSVVGRVNYATGEIQLQSLGSRWATGAGTPTVSYQYYGIPGTSDVPVRALLRRIHLRQTAGSATEYTWAVYGDPDQEYAPAASGVLTLGGGEASADLDRVVSVSMSADEPASRWIVLTPDAGADNEYVVTLFWENADS